MGGQVQEGADDPYAAVSPHGIWPLVRDPESPLGLRFAVMGEDPPEACVSSPSDLPDIGLALRGFDCLDTRKTWMAAAREFGGNSLVLLPAPALRNSAFQCVLIGWLNREATANASTLEEAIPLLRDLEKMQAEGKAIVDQALPGARQRQEDLRRRAENGERAAWNAAWSSELRALGASGELVHYHHGKLLHDTLDFNLKDRSYERGTLTRIHGGIRAAIQALPSDGLDADLVERMHAESRVLGWRYDAKGLFTLDLPVLDADAVGRIAREARSLWTAGSRVSSLKDSRRSLLAVWVDPETVKVLRRMADGFPVASGRYADPAAQFNPRTGRPQGVAASRVKRCHLAGLIEPVFWREAKGRRHPNNPFDVASLHDIEGILWGLTETGRTFVTGEVEGAADTHGADTATAMAWTSCTRQPGGRDPQPHDGLDAVTARLPKPSPKAIEAIGNAFRSQRTSHGLPRQAEGLSIAGAALAAGVALPEAYVARAA